MSIHPFTRKRAAACIQRAGGDLVTAAEFATRAERANRRQAATAIGHDARKRAAAIADDYARARTLIQHARRAEELEDVKAGQHADARRQMY